MRSFGTARCAVAPACLSTRTRSDRRFPEPSGACGKGGGGRYETSDSPRANSTQHSALVWKRCSVQCSTTFPSHDWSPVSRGPSIRCFMGPPRHRLPLRRQKFGVRPGPCRRGDVEYFNTDGAASHSCSAGALVSVQHHLRPVTYAWRMPQHTMRLGVWHYISFQYCQPHAVS